MERRNFIKLGLVGSAGALMIPAQTLASPKNSLDSSFAGSVYFTSNKPGRWKGKQGGHVPTFEIENKQLVVTTGHDMHGYKHYIVKHVILNEDMEFVSEVLFDPEKDVPISEHKIAGLGRRAYAISLCNLHDAWLNAVDL